MKIMKTTALLLALTAAVQLNAQRILTLEECRSLALESNKELQESRFKVEMSGFDKKTAMANYFPEISVKGAYLYNTSDISLIGDEASLALRNAGTTVQGQVGNAMGQLMEAIKTNPAAAAEYMNSPMWQTVIGTLSQTDLSQALNAIGSQIDEELHPDLHNVYAGVVSVNQPIFMGGKIVNANRMAGLAKQLAETKLDGKEQDVLASVDEAYWQIVSVAAKSRLAEDYAKLLHGLENDVHISVLEGVATPSDELQIKVKANEAEMMRLRARNGLVLSKMLLCKQVGLPLDSDIMLADENTEEIPLPADIVPMTDEDIWNSRSETRALALAGDIYDTKVKMAAADLMPKVALTANYLVTNPSVANGFRNDFAGNFNAGVMISIPIFHGMETNNKVRKAKVEANMYRNRYDNAKELISMQVTQLRQQRTEARECLDMSRDNLAFADENLRTATVGFEEGVINANTVLAAHTAWLQAKTEMIEASINLNIKNLELMKAQGIQENR